MNPFDPALDNILLLLLLLLLLLFVCASGLRVCVCARVCVCDIKHTQVGW